MYSSFLLLNHHYICVHWALFSMHSPLEDDVETSASAKVVQAQVVPQCATETLSALKLRCRIGAGLGAGTTSVHPLLPLEKKVKNHGHQDSGNTSRITFNSSRLQHLKLLFIRNEIVLPKNNPNYWWGNLDLISDLSALNKNWCSVKKVKSISARPVQSRAKS